jgi:hypothetical protein
MNSLEQKVKELERRIANIEMFISIISVLGCLIFLILLHFSRYPK